jgi:uncharacterized protein YceH (UPF0502 family)
MDPFIGPIVLLLAGAFAGEFAKEGGKATYRLIEGLAKKVMRRSDESKKAAEKHESATQDFENEFAPLKENLAKIQDRLNTMEKEKKLLQDENEILKRKKPKGKS